MKMTHAMHDFVFFCVYPVVYHQPQPPILYLDEYRWPMIVLALLFVGNILLIVVAMFLRRRLNDIEATRPPSRKKRGTAESSSDEPAAQPHDQVHQ